MNLLNHPFYQEWTAGKLRVNRLHNYSVQYYHHVGAFPRYLSGIHTGCADLRTGRPCSTFSLTKSAAMRITELWLRFAEALAVARETVCQRPNP